MITTYENDRTRASYNQPILSLLGELFCDPLHENK